MARRYSNINQGTELKLAQDNLEKYRKTRVTKRTAASPTVGASRPTQEVVIKPFDTSSPDKIIVSIVKASFNKLNPALPARLSVAVPDLVAGIKVNRFRPARIHFFEPTAATRTYVKSKITGLNYLKYPGASYSAPFGALAANEEEAAAGRSIKTAVLSLSTKDYKRAWLSSEHFPI